MDNKGHFHFELSFKGHVNKKSTASTPGHVYRTAPSRCLSSGEEEVLLISPLISPTVKQQPASISVCFALKYT